MEFATPMDDFAAVPAHPLTRDEFDLFYTRTAAALRSYICRIAGASSMADDVLQESYVRLLSAPPMQEAHRKSYLYRTATNLVTDYHRARTRVRRWWPFLPRRDEAADSGVELSSDLEKLFTRLSARERALLWLAYVEGAGHREIAAILGLQPKSIKVLLFRARAKMEAILIRHGFEARHE